MAKKKGSDPKASSKKKSKVAAKPTAPRRAAAPKAKGPLFPAWVQFPSIAGNDNPLYPQIFKALAAIILLTMMFMAPGVGINGDDKMQNEYEQKLMSYYATFGEDEAALNLPKTDMHLYGGVFEVLSGATNRLLGYDSPEKIGYHKVRHVYNAIFGFLGMLFVALLARMIAGWQAAILALVFMFLSPRFLGHSMMNPKDIPFAAGYIMSVYFIAVLLKELPKPKISTLIGLTIAIGISIGTRAGGLLVVAYLGLFAGLDFLAKYGLPALFKEGKLVLSYLKATLIPVFGGLVIAIIFWPYAQQDPFNNILEALAALSNYRVNIRLLFGGELVYAQELPVDYLPRWVLFTVPLFFITGLVAFIVFMRSIFKNYATMPILLSIFAFLFPFAYVILNGSTVYDGWRHLIFPYTAGVVLTAVAWHFLWHKFNAKPVTSYVVIGAVALMMLEPAIFIARNIHYPYVYFNPIAGGMDGAFGQYETDYWGVSVKQAVDWLEDEGILHDNLQEKVYIATNFHYQLDKYLKNKYNGKAIAVYIRYRERYNRNWDYGIFLSRFARGSHLRNGTWPTKKSIHTIDANNTPLLAILKKVDDNPFKGHEAIKRQDWPTAIQYLSAEVKNFPDNELAWLGLGNAYLNTNDLPKAKECLDKCLSIEPESLGALNYIGLYYLRTNNIAEAEKVFRNTIELESKNSFGYYYLAIIENQRKNIDAAINYAKSAIEANGRFKPAYKLSADLYQAKGDQATAKKFLDAMAKIQ